jgi:hypothetical protein
MDKNYFIYVIYIVKYKKWVYIIILQFFIANYIIIFFILKTVWPLICSVLYLIRRV